MSNDPTTPERRYPQPAPEHSGVIDAARIAESIRLIDSDMAVALRTATYEALGRVVLGNAASIARGDTDRVPTAEAVKAHVADALAGVIGATPGVLDTLAELAQALGDDPDFAATIAASIATKADKAATETALADRPTKAEVSQSVAAVDGKLIDYYKKSESDGKYILSGIAAKLNERVASRNFDLLDQSDNGDYKRLRFSSGNLRLTNKDGVDHFMMFTDGNIFGPVWGNDWLSIHIEKRCDAYRTDTKNFVWQHYVNDCRMSGWWEAGRWLNNWAHCPAGGVVTAWYTRTVSAYDTVIDFLGGRYFQCLRGGNWYTIGVW